MKHLKVKIPFLIFGNEGKHVMDLQYMSDEELGYMIKCFEEEREMRVRHFIGKVRCVPLHELKRAKE